MESHEMLLFCRKVASHYAALCIEDVRKGCGAVQAEVDRRRERGVVMLFGLIALGLMLIAAAWTYVAKMQLWKRALLFVSAFPIAILGNSLRLVSIFVMAEYGDAKFASGTWHDWSPLVFFYPISLLLLLTVHSVLEGGLPWKASKRRVLRRVHVSQSKPELINP
jgi:exosortase/archaeosortase family protein